jgi:hypothetical protein
MTAPFSFKWPNAAGRFARLRFEPCSTQFASPRAAPLFYEAPDTGRQPPTEQPTRRNLNDSGVLAVLDVHVRGRMVVMEQPHDDPKKYGHDRHP